MALNINEEEVVETIRDPESIDQKGTQYFAIKAINVKYALRVVYEEKKRLSSCYLL